MSWAEKEAADIHAAFADQVRYTGAGLTNASIAAVKYDEDGEPFQGGGNTLRKVTFEVLRSALPQAPVKGNTIVEDDGAGQSWRVNDITRRNDIAAWQLVVERVA